MREQLEANANSAVAVGAKSYMRNISEFYGIAAPVRGKLLKEFIQKYGIPDISNAPSIAYYTWAQEQREWQYIGMDIIAKYSPKGDGLILEVAEWMITQKSWWDTVDYIAANIVGEVCKKDTALRDVFIEKWRNSDNIWLQRSCIIHQLKYKNDVDKLLLFDLCKQFSHHQDFFIRKAIGWALRQYAKYNAEDVKLFVNTHTLSNLSRKEALKHIATVP